MRDAVAFSNIALGVIYTSYGIMTLLDLKQGWKTRGFSHFGAAWVAMAFTCGPHHLEHGLHVYYGTGGAGVLDLMAVLVGFPAGAAWFLLRVEALAGGRGDRVISGTPLWLSVLPFLGLVYLWVLATGTVLTLYPTPEFTPRMVPNVLLLGIYCVISYYLFRSQFAAHRETSAWSVSGLCLGVVFVTCGLMHAMFAVYAAAGTYNVEWVGLVIDWAAVPAAIYFVWVVRALYMGRLTDWNESARPIQLQSALV